MSLRSEKLSKTIADLQQLIAPYSHWDKRFDNAQPLRQIKLVGLMNFLFFTTGFPNRETHLLLAQN